MLLFRVVVVVLFVVSALLTPLAVSHIAAETVSPTVVTTHIPWDSAPEDPTRIDGAQVLTSPLDGTTHVIVSDPSDSTIWHFGRSTNGQWGLAERVAAGSEFDAEFQQDGVLHVVFAHNFDVNYDIFHVVREPGLGMRWTLPIPVTYTTGDSRNPKLAIHGNRLHCVWDDNSPGYNTAYYGDYTADAVTVAVSSIGSPGLAKPRALVSTPTNLHDLWNYRPIPNGRGSNPIIYVEKNGTIHVAWLESGELCLVSKTAEGWLLPSIVSDDARVVSIKLVARACPDNGVRVIWADTSALVLYRDGILVTETRMLFTGIHIWTPSLQMLCRSYIPGV